MSEPVHSAEGGAAETPNAPSASVGVRKARKAFIPLEYVLPIHPSIHLKYFNENMKLYSLYAIVAGIILFVSPGLFVLTELTYPPMQMQSRIDDFLGAQTRAVQELSFS